ncbi:hypothetical protein THAOC_01629, partial [Thalassiosira oceanica]
MRLVPRRDGLAQLGRTSARLPTLAEKLRSQRTAKWGEGSVHSCSYDCDDGRCRSTDWGNENCSSDWQGCEGLPGSGTIGMLLDLDKGTLSVFKNGRRLGAMKEGLSGEYCWFSLDLPPNRNPASPPAPSMGRGFTLRRFSTLLATSWSFPVTARPVDCRVTRRRPLGACTLFSKRRRPATNHRAPIAKSLPERCDFLSSALAALDIMTSRARPSGTRRPRTPRRTAQSLAARGTPALQARPRRGSGPGRRPRRASLLPGRALSTRARCWLDPRRGARTPDAVDLTIPSSRRAGDAVA